MLSGKTRSTRESTLKSAFLVRNKKWREAIISTMYLGVPDKRIFQGTWRSVVCPVLFPRGVEVYRTMA
jgi:hypothetical protein